jgi:hypothetical protein
MVTTTAKGAEHRIRHVEPLTPSLLLGSGQSLPSACIRRFPKEISFLLQSWSPVTMGTVGVSLPLPPRCTWLYENTLSN